MFQYLMESINIFFKMEDDLKAMLKVLSDPALPLLEMQVSFMLLLWNLYQEYQQFQCNSQGELKGWCFWKLYDNFILS